MKGILLFIFLVSIGSALHLEDIQHQLTVHSISTQMMHDQIIIPHFLVKNYDAIRAQYLASFPPGDTVDGAKATQLATFFASDMGLAILGYFDSLTVQANGQRGLNRYNLTPPNFRLWMAIKILAGSDTNKYARSLAADKALFVQFIDKTTN